MALNEKGNFIVGNYDEHGKQLTPGKFVGTPADIERIRRKYQAHADKLGETIPVAPSAPEVKKKVSRRKAKKNDAPIENLISTDRYRDVGYVSLEEMDGLETTEAIHAISRSAHDAGAAMTSAISTITSAIRTKKTVSFENNFGTTRCKVLEVIDNGFGIMLVFNEDDDMTFIPKKGEALLFTLPNGQQAVVYYPGLVFDWTDGVKKLMLLIRVPNDYESTDQPYDGARASTDDDATGSTFGPVDTRLPADHDGSSA